MAEVDLTDLDLAEKRERPADDMLSTVVHATLADEDPPQLSDLDDPMAFDIRRSPNPHLALGHGVHYCLGANLARLEMRLMFEELMSRFERFRLVEPVEWARSNRHTGIRHAVLAMS